MDDTSLSNIQDYKGARFFAGATCFRRNWVDLKEKSGAAVDECFSWKVVWSDDKTHLRLVSRPADFDIALTEESASFFDIYNEATQLAPEKYPRQWKQLLQIGWVTWAELLDDANTVVLRAYNQNSGGYWRITDYLSKQYLISDFGAGMWDALLFGLEGEFSNKKL